MLNSIGAGLIAGSLLIAMAVPAFAQDVDLDPFHVYTTAASAPTPMMERSSSMVAPTAHRHRHRCRAGYTSRYCIYRRNF